MMKKLWYAWLALLLMAITLNGGEAPPLERYVIAVGEGYVPAEMTAATELQQHLERLCGHRLPIVSTDHPAAPAIRLGQSAAIGEALGIPDFSALQADEIRLQSVGDDLICTGARPRGTLYAVYTLLEEHLGVRFWSARETAYPEATLTRLPQLSVRYVPPFAIREPFVVDATYSGARFAAISRNNGHWSPVNAAYGGHESILGFCHTFARILPPEELLGTHPEWFSLVDGKRTGAQLCLSNPEMRAEFIHRAAKWLTEHPEAMVISLSQNDTVADFCSCPACINLTEREQGRQSGVLLDFINEAAAALEKIRPGVIVETLAYNYTVEAPLVTMPAPNVMIRLCVIGANFGLPLTAECNRSFARSLNDWRAVCRRIGVWHYLANFSNFLLPFPDWQCWGEDFRLFREHGVYSVFAQGDTLSGGAGDFTALRAYLLRRLLWNPDLDVWALQREFVDGYYGAAAPAILRYLEIIQRQMRRDRAPFLGCYLDNTDSWLPMEELLKGYRCMEEAMDAVADDSVMTRRVRNARLAILCALLLRPEITMESERFGFTLEQLRALAQELIADGAAIPATYYSETNKFADLVFRLRVQYRLLEAPRPEELPPELRGKNPAKMMVLRHESFRIYEENRNVFAVADPEAIGGKAWRLNPVTGAWLIQHDLPELKKRVRVYAGVRAEGNSATEDACLIAGIEGAARKSQWRSFQARDVVGAHYRYVDLGEYELTGGDYFYCAAVPNPDIDGIWVDQLILEWE